MRHHPIQLTLTFTLTPIRPTEFAAPQQRRRALCSIINRHYQSARMHGFSDFMIE
nr:hypothetical protein [Shewanella putrefaciens]